MKFFGGKTIFDAGKKRLNKVVGKNKRIVAWNFIFDTHSVIIHQADVVLYRYDEKNFGG